MDIDIHRQFEIIKTFFQHLFTEAWIKRTVHLYCIAQRHLGHLIFFRHDENLAQGFRATHRGVCPVEKDLTVLWTEESAYKIEQSALSHSVFTEKTVDTVLFHI